MYKERLILMIKIVCKQVEIIFAHIDLVFARVWLVILTQVVMIYRFYKSLRAYLRLYRAGFSISNSVNDTKFPFEINRFYWRGMVIRQMPDIDRVGDHYNTIHNGNIEKLS